MKNHAHDATALPFVTTGNWNERHCFWSVNPSGNDFEDARMGKEYAHAYLEFESDNKAGSVLSIILDDMITAKDRSLVAKHFIYEIASALELALENPWFIEAVKNRRKKELPFI